MTPSDAKPSRFALIAYRTLAILVGVGILATVIGRCAGEPPLEPESVVPAEPTSIASSVEGISSVLPFEDALIVGLQLDGTAGDADYVFRVGDAVKSIAAVIQSGATDDAAQANELDLSVSSAATDRLGNPRTVHVLTLTFPMADLRAARLDNLSVGRVLNLTSDIRFGGHGAGQLLAYCASERGRTQSRPFCALAESRATN